MGRLKDWLSQDVRETNRNLGQEILKQFSDQLLHVLMGIGSVAGIGSAALALHAPLWLAALSSALLTFSWEAVREINQGWSDRPWDSPTDIAFEAIGIGLGVWLLVDYWAPFFSMTAWPWILQLFS